MTRSGLTMSGRIQCLNFWIPRLETNGEILLKAGEARSYCKSSNADNIEGNASSLQHMQITIRKSLRNGALI